jgi:PKD repeat protein
MEDSIGCSPLTVRFRNGSQGYATYMYQFGNSGGATGNAESGIMNTHTFRADNGHRDKTFDVKLTVSRGSCSAAITKQVLVYAQPNAEFRPKGADPAVYYYPVTAGVGVDNLIQPPVDAAYLTYAWSWTNLETGVTTAFSDQPNPAPFPVDDWGHFSITQHVMAPNGKCSDSHTVPFDVVPPPAEAFFEEVAPACVPYEVQFVNNTEYARAFRWDFGDGNTSGDANPKHVFMKPGTFTVTLTARGFDMTEYVFTRQITVHPTPQAGFEVFPNFRWVGQPVDAANYTTHEIADGQQYDVWYRWNWGDGTPETTVENPSHMYLKSGAYDITLTTGTYTSPQCISVATKTGAVTLESAGDIILPNIFKPTPSGEPSCEVPTTGYKNYLFYPPVLSPTRKYNMKIFNRWGIQIFESNDPNCGWNGYFKGRICDEGVFTYKVEGVFETGQSFMKVGDVTLLR